MKHLILGNVPFLGLILGILFGLGLYYAGATNRVVIRNMLNLKDLTLMKIIIFAIGWGMSLTYLGVAFDFIDLGHFSIKTMNLGVILGSFILAFGFGLIGLCPGTAIASFGAGYLKSIYVILGGLVGAFLFTSLYPVFKSIGLFESVLGGKTTLIFLSDNYNFIFHSTPWVGVIIGIVLMFISLMIPHSIKN